MLSTRSQDGLSFLLPAAAAAIICAFFWGITTSDIILSYVPWLQHIATTGPLTALGAPIGDYAPPYYYLLALLSPAYGLLPAESLVKLASTLSMVLLAFAVRHLLDVLKVTETARWAAYLLLLPSMIFNAAISASCDGFWAAAAVMAIAMAVRHRHGWMLVFCGVALSIKAQAIFAAPALLAVLLARRVAIRFWPLAPLAMAAMYLPAYLLGWPLADLLTIYLRQADMFERLSLNAANLWAIAQLIPALDIPQLATFGYAAAIAASVGLVVILRGTDLEGPTLLAAATLSILLTAGLLPRMHERYFFLADVLAFAFAVVAGTRGAWITAALVQLGSTLAIAAYATGRPELAAAGAVPMIAATWRFGRFIASRRMEAGTAPQNEHSEPAIV